MLAAGNTSGEGENEAFSSRGKMDESLQERMTPIFIDYDDRVEERILNKYPEWYQFFVNFRKACLKYASSIGQVSAQGIATTRDAAAIRKYIAAQIITRLGKRVPDIVLLSLIKYLYPEISPSEYYHNSDFACGCYRGLCLYL